jgi:hypothetical protein
MTEWQIRRVHCRINNVANWQRRTDSANGLVRMRKPQPPDGLGLTGDRSIAFSNCVVSLEYNVQPDSEFRLVLVL